MIHSIPRVEVFWQSWVVDHYISERQKSMYDAYSSYLEEQREEKSIPDSFDHLEPFHNRKEELDDSAILGYVQKNTPDFLAHRSSAFIHFFELLDVKKLYLLDELKYDWLQFPFSYREKRQAFQNLVNQTSYLEALEFDITDLSLILPLFHFSGHHNKPIIWLFPAHSPVELAMFLCDDNNLHASFLQNDRKK